MLGALINRLIMSGRSAEVGKAATDSKPTLPNSQPVQPQGPRSVNARHAERSQIRSNFPKLPIP